MYKELLTQLETETLYKTLPSFLNYLQCIYLSKLILSPYLFLL